MGQHFYFRYSFKGNETTNLKISVLLCSLQHYLQKSRYGRKAMKNLDSVLKSRDITLKTKSKLLLFQQSCMDVRAEP